MIDLKKIAKEIPVGEEDKALAERLRTLQGTRYGQADWVMEWNTAAQDPQTHPSILAWMYNVSTYQGVPVGCLERLAANPNTPLEVLTAEGLVRNHEEQIASNPAIDLLKLERPDYFAQLLAEKPWVARVFGFKPEPKPELIADAFSSSFELIEPKKEEEK